MVPDLEMLMRQAPYTAGEFLRSCVVEIDNTFGEGFAKKNPELLGQMILVASRDFEMMINRKEI